MIFDKSSLVSTSFSNLCACMFHFSVFFFSQITTNEIANSNDKKNGLKKERLRKIKKEEEKKKFHNSNDIHTYKERERKKEWNEENERKSRKHFINKSCSFLRLMPLNFPLHYYAWNCSCHTLFDVLCVIKVSVNCLLKWTKNKFVIRNKREKKSKWYFHDSYQNNLQILMSDNSLAFISLLIYLIWFRFLFNIVCVMLLNSVCSGNKNIIWDLCLQMDLTTIWFGFNFEENFRQESGGDRQRKRKRIWLFIKLIVLSK